MSKKHTQLYFALVCASTLAISAAVTTPAVFAVKASPTPAAKPAASTQPASSPETTTEIKKRIERVVDENRDQVKGSMDEASGKKRGFIGQVQRVSQEAITLKNTKGTQILPLTDTVILMNTKRKKITIDDVPVDAWVIAIGSLEDDAFIPRRLIVSTDTLRPTAKTILLGTIKALDTKTVTVIARDTKEEKKLTLIKDTKFQNQGGETAVAKQFSADLQVLVIGSETNGTVNAVTVRSLAPLPAASPATRR